MPPGSRALALLFVVFAGQAASAYEVDSVHLLKSWEEQAFASNPELTQELSALKREALLKAGGLTSLCAGFLTFDAFVIVPAIPRFVAGLPQGAQVATAVAALGGGAWVVKEMYQEQLRRLLNAPGRQDLRAFAEVIMQFEIMIRAAQEKRGASEVLYSSIRTRFSNLDWPADLTWMEVKLSEWLNAIRTRSSLIEPAKQAPLDAFAAWLWSTR